MDELLQILLKYPLIKRELTKDVDVILFTGHIVVQDKSYSVVLQEVTTIDGREKYKLLDFGCKEGKISCDVLNETFMNNDFQDVTEVLDRIKAYLEHLSPNDLSGNYCDIYRKVLNEYTEFTKFFLNLKSCKLKEDLTKIFVSVTDEKHREHFVEISIDYFKTTLNIFQISTFDLPQKEQALFKANDSLTALFDQFLAQMEYLQLFFDTMEEFDKNCTIMDPEKPRRQDAYRRIWLGENISVVITFDPYNVVLRPDIRILGPDRLAEPFNSRLNENLGHWVVAQNNIFQTVLDLLGLDHFPQCESKKKTANLLVEFGECSICFSLRLDDKFPDIICSNKSCEQFYHNKCLYYWLLSLNAKRVFNNISGNCPNCEKTITCPVLE